jgi:hypothetical protein
MVQHVGVQGSFIRSK